MSRFDVVVSAENNCFLVWQAMLFHYSCLHYQGQAPIVVVHKNHEPLLPGFERIRAADGIVQTAPNYRRQGGVNYPPRNTAATLRHVVSEADFVILCDADMIFTRPLPLDEVALSGRQITFDRVSYLDPDRAEHQPALDQTCRRAGVEAARLRAQPMNGGVPHVVPKGLKQLLSDEWLACLELFPTLEPWTPTEAVAASRECHIGPQKSWLAIMWALVLAVHRLELEPVVTDWCTSNYQGNQPLPGENASASRMVHYCYADHGFNKHLFDSHDAAEHGVWHVATGDGTVSGAVRKQIHEARAMYRRDGYFCKNELLQKFICE